MTEMDEIIAEDPQDPAHDGARDRVLIVDFGSQVTQLIARRVREAGVYSEIVPFDKAEAGLGPVLPKAIILSGGPASVHESGTPQAPQAVFSAGVPVLGICYGEQAMVAALGGQVEVVHTPKGAALIANFVREIAGCEGDWSMAQFREAEITRIRDQVDEGRVVCGLSGGVDSAVAALLIHEAIGDQLTCIFVDHGLLRQDEATEVV